MKLAATAISLALLALPACEKAGSSGEASGKLDDSERALLGHIPAGANVVFGGNYKKLLAYWDNSPLKRLTAKSMAALGSGKLSDYMDCWMNGETSDVTMAGSVEVRGGTAMNMIFGGLSKQKLETCAKKAGFPIETSADGKWVELGDLPDGLGGTTSAGYYFIDDKIAFFSIDMNLSGLGAPSHSATRAAIEAKLATAKSSPAIDDPTIKKMIEQADRSKAFWVSGDAAGTPLADKVGAGHAWFDVSEDAFTIGFSIELDSAETASDAVAGFNDAKREIDSAPSQIREAAGELMKGVKLSARGKVLSGEVRVTNALVDKALPALEMLGGGF